MSVGPHESGFSISIQVSSLIIRPQYDFINIWVVLILKVPLRVPFYKSAVLLWGSQRDPILENNPYNYATVSRIPCAAAGYDASDPYIEDRAP